MSGRGGAVAARTAVALLALIGAGCERVDSSSDVGAQAACAAPSFSPPYSAVDSCSAEAVLISAARAIFTYRPDDQSDTAASLRAAAPLIAPDYLHRIGASAATLAPITASTWARWQALHISVTATAHIAADDHPADSRHFVSREIAVTQHAGNEPPRAITVCMQATRTGAHAPWLVTDVEVK